MPSALSLTGTVPSPLSSQPFISSHTLLTVPNASNYHIPTDTWLLG